MSAAAHVVEFVDVVDGIMFRSVFLPFKGMTVPQHRHDVSHPTYCGAGKARLYVNGRMAADVEAGRAISIEAGKDHLFEALEDNTRLTCVFDAARAEELKGKGY